MAAGLGFKTFTTGEVLTSADTNGYLMQGVLVFADAAARDAAITSPQEGQFAYLKDTDVTTYYTSSAWANLDTTGMTNPMTTTADIIYSSSGSTPARLGIGTVGQVLTVNSGATAPEWAAAASGLPSWTTYTPSLSGSITIGNGTLTGRYMESNTTIIAEVTVLFGSTTTINSTVFLGLPFSASSNSGNQIHSLHLRDEGTATFTGHAIVSGSSVVCYIDGAAATYVTSVGINSTTPFTWASTDFIKLNIVYEKS
jgi:hypothetical protein